MAWDFRRKSVERVVKEVEAEAEDEAAPLEGAEVEQEEEERASPADGISFRRFRLRGGTGTTTSSSEESDIVIADKESTRKNKN